MTETPPSATRSTRDRTWARVMVVLLLIAGLLYAARQLGGYVPAFAQWVDELGFWGPIVFILSYVVATVALIPASFLTLAAGAIFGLATGVGLVFVAASIGAIAAFLIARYLARGAIEKRVESDERFAAIDRAVAREGRKIVFLLRLSPAFPFGLLNYALGLTRVRLLDYAIGCFGMIPGTLLYTYYGKVVGDVASLAAGESADRGTAYYAVMAAGLVATIAVTTIVTRTARRALREAQRGSEVGAAEDAA